MKKFPMIKRLGLSIEHKIVSDFDQNNKREVYSISAIELEDLLQKSLKLYFQKNDNGFQHFKTDKNHNPNFAGLLVAPTPLFQPCEKHEPEDEDAEFTTCKRCDMQLKLIKRYETEG